MEFLLLVNGLQLSFQFLDLEVFGCILLQIVFVHFVKEVLDLVGHFLISDLEYIR